MLNAQTDHLFLTGIYISQDHKDPSLLKMCLVSLGAQRLNHITPNTVALETVLWTRSPSRETTSPNLKYHWTQKSRVWK